MNESDIQTVREYYDGDPASEYGRIAGRPEFLLTERFMKRVIKKGDSVLDIGGGPGIYSHMLAKMGCKVTLCDLSGGNVEFAKDKAKELGLEISALRGDAREADKLISGQFDHVLLMGPLYHLLEESDRVKAINAALSLLKTGGTLWCSFIMMFSGIIYEMKNCPEMIASDLPVEREFRRATLEGRSYGGDAFTKAYFIAQKEIEPFMNRFPLEKLYLFSQEGILSPCENNIMSQPESIVSAWLDFAEKLAENPELLSWGEHAMYVGRKVKIMSEEFGAEMDRIVNSPCRFEDFAALEPRDGDLWLRTDEMSPAVPEKKWVPAYKFSIMQGDERVGGIDLRIGFTEGLYYGGNIGYNVVEEYRGRGFAARAVRLLEPFLRAHGMQNAIITNDVGNTASRRVCEKLGLTLLRKTELPEWTELYKDGMREVNVFEWRLA